MKTPFQTRPDSVLFIALCLMLGIAACAQGSPDFHGAGGAGAGGSVVSTTATTLITTTTTTTTTGSTTTTTSTGFGGAATTTVASTTVGLITSGPTVTSTSTNGPFSTGLSATTGPFSTSTHGSTTGSGGSGGSGPTLGASCAAAVDVTTATFPYTLSGSYQDDPPLGTSCDATPTNAVWFEYTAPDAGDYQVDLTDNTAGFPSTTMVVFDGTACSPYGMELLCGSVQSPAVTATVTLTQGQTILILFHTTRAGAEMLDPSISITPVVHGPGDGCANAVDVSTETFPYKLTGEFDSDPAVGGSCDTTPTNAVWFSYTAPSAGDFTIDLVNHTTTNAYSRVAIFDGTACSPLGTELLCITADKKSASAGVTLAQGQSILILFHTDDDLFTMVDPEITVTPVVYGPGDACDTAVDVSTKTFPYQLTGTFDTDPALGGSCDFTSPTNAVWFSYTAASAGDYTLTLVNHTTHSVYSSMAVFDGLTCSPYGGELACLSDTGKTLTATLTLAQSQTILVLFHTSEDSETMVDPTISLDLLSPGNPGESCDNPVDVSSVTFPYALTGTFPRDPALGGTCDTQPTNAVWFSYSPPATAIYKITLANGTTTSASSRVAVFEGTTCGPYGEQLSCLTASPKSISTTTYMEQGKTYLILFHTDENIYSMVDPKIRITQEPITAGEVCQMPQDVSTANFPYTLQGTFGVDAQTGGSCDDTPTNPVWFSFTPTTTGTYTIHLTNATTTPAYARAVVFTGTSCEPLGMELDCETKDSKSVTAHATLTAGQPYLILFHTDADAYTMIDPQITITP